jgi:hypothetical protein
LIALIRAGKMSSRQALHRLRFQDDFSLAQSLPSLFDVADPTTQVAILESAEGIGTARPSDVAASEAISLAKPRQLYSVDLSALRSF